MGSNKSDSKNRRSTNTPHSDDARQNKLINLANNLAEERLANGTASSQLVSIYVKQGTPKARKELEIMEEQRKLLEAKTKAIKSAQYMEELYKNAMLSMKEYLGANDYDEDF